MEIDPIKWARAHLKPGSRVFVLKLGTVEGYERARNRNIWATPLHSSPPHPHEILSAAYSVDLPPVFVISVTGTRRYQGVAIMRSLPGGSQTASSLVIEDGPFSDKQLGPPFDIEWLIQTSDPTQEGLHFSRTASLTNKLSPDESCVNLSRNCQEIDSNTGIKLCELILSDIIAQRKERERIEKRNARVAPVSFFSLSEEQEREMIESTSTLWNTFLSRVRDSIGDILLATVIGSRRYNLQSPASDLDLFVVSLYPIERVLQYPSADQTFKNPESSRPDFTVYGLEYFCQLLRAGDTKVVECLFLDQHVVHFSAPLWSDLVENRLLFVSKQVIKTYVGEVRGPKGLKQMDRLWQQLQTESSGSDATATVKFFKKWYIVLRCLIHADRLLRDAKTFRAWFDSEDESRAYLLDIRNGKYSHETLWAESNKRLSELENNIKSCSLPDSLTQTAYDFLQQWYLKVRTQQNPTLTLGACFDETSAIWSRLKIPVAAPEGKLLFAAQLRVQPAFFFGIFCGSIDTSLSLDYQIKRKPLNISNARGNKTADASPVEYQFYELDSLIDAFTRGDLFVFVNCFTRRQRLSPDCRNVFFEHQLFVELSEFSDRLITSTLMLAASGWLASGISQRMRGKSPSELFTTIDADIIVDVIDTYLRCMRYASGQAEHDDVCKRLNHAASLLEQARPAVESKAPETVLQLLSQVDKEVEPIKPFTSVLPSETDVSWLQQWSSRTRIFFYTS